MLPPSALDLKATPPAPLRARPLSGKVLLAEDGPDNQRLISFMLRKANLDFVLVSNGALALEATRKEQFDLILMDMQMPVMDGYTATQKLRQEGCTVPIVALTANIMKQDVEKCLAVGCSDFLGKPFERQAFIDKLTLYLKPAVEILEFGPAEAEPPMSASELAIVRNFVNRLPSRLEAIDVQARSGDWEKVAALAHQLRAAAMFGYSEFGEVAGKLEDASRGGRAAEAGTLLASLHRICDQISKEMEEATANTSLQPFVPPNSR
jgi:CheY-like chemotaxis protein